MTWSSNPFETHMEQKKYEAELKDLELKLDRLRSLYEQYFRGIEKMPPNILKKDVEGKIRKLQKIRMKNTALRFRLQVQVQKYTTFLAYWQRMLRELESGGPRRGGAEAEGERPVRGYVSDRGRRKEPDELLDIDIDVDTGY
jgi:hypothetical protein